MEVDLSLQARISIPDEVLLSDANIRELVERTQALEGSNARLRRRIENMRADEGRIHQQNEELMLRIGGLQEALALQQQRSQKKDPLRLRLAGSVENFANRTGEKWPAVSKERRRPFPGVAQEPGAAIDAIKQILAQVFDSVHDAFDFFNASRTDKISRSELGRGLARLKVQNLDSDHLLWDLHRRPEDGLTQLIFLEAFDWKKPSNRFNCSLGSESLNSTLSSVRESKPRVDAAVSKALAENPLGWDANAYMSKFRAEQKQERSKPQWDPATLIDIVPPEDVRLLTAREKFMIKSMQLPADGKFRPPKSGQKSWAERLSAGWKSEAEEEDPEVLALEREKQTMELLRNRVKTAKSSQPFKLDLSGLSNPKLPEAVTFTPRQATKIKPTKPRHKLTEGFPFSEDSENVKRLMREHEAIISSRRPVVSAVTSDHVWLKQSILLEGIKRKEMEASREKERYDLDGRCHPLEVLSRQNDEGTAIGSADGGDPNDLDARINTAMTSGDDTEVMALIKSKRDRGKSPRTSRNPYEHASPANIAYMKLQAVSNSSASTMTSPRDDPVLRNLLDRIAGSYPRGGTVVSKIQDPSRAPTIQDTPRNKDADEHTARRGSRPTLKRMSTSHAAAQDPL